jgi:hypothetical protein
MDVGIAVPAQVGSDAAADVVPTQLPVLVPKNIIAITFEARRQLDVLPPFPQQSEGFYVLRVLGSTDMIVDEVGIRFPAHESRIAAQAFPWFVLPSPHLRTIPDDWKVANGISESHSLGIPLREAEGNSKVTPDAHENESSSALGDTIVRGIREPPSHPVTKRMELLRDKLRKVLPIVREHAGHIFHDEDFGLEVAHEAQEPLVEPIARIIDNAFAVYALNQGP